MFEHAPVTNLLIEELVQVKTDHLGFLGNSQVHERNVLERIQQDAGNNERVGGNGTDLGELAADLDAHAIEGTLVDGCAVESRDPLLGEDAGEE